ncbi:MAG: 5-(carboxyamino)imidazole ribonucleotide synthase [Pseudomonadota bacterium]|nr:5-(carboxyamino)imidazole ribonucleotide synthase [Pseudomonadota bacterium]
MTTIGILGGGQLARMLALSGAPLGMRFLALDVAPDACAAQFVPLIVADYHDTAALARFASEVDVVTFDFENVPADSAHWLAERLPVYPNPDALEVAQDRLQEKQLFQELGMATPEYRAVDSREDLDLACTEIGFPCILKTRRLGYDGKGQFRLRSADDIAAAWAALGRAPLILEAFIPFDRELSVVAVRAQDGEFRAYPLTQNWHADGVLSLSLAPAPNSDEVAAEAFEFAQLLADRLDYVGVFALELFERDGQLLANEMAPRVHNSGHWTIEGADCSQFANHLRAVAGLPLGSTATLGISAMLNWIGELPDRQPVMAEPRGYFHDYGKTARVGRKVGHATLVAATPTQLAAALVRVACAIDRMPQVEAALALLAPVQGRSE